MANTIGSVINLYKTESKLTLKSFILLRTTITRQNMDMEKDTGEGEVVEAKL